MAEPRRTGLWCHAIGGCSGEYYSPTAGFLTPSAVLSGVNAFEAGRVAVAADAVRLARVDRAKLPALFVLLLRWDEIKAATAGVMTWPATLPTKEAAFFEYGRAANETALATRCHYLDGGSRPGHLFVDGARCSAAQAQFAGPRPLGSGQPPLPFFEWFWLQVFGGTAQDAWCQTLPSFPQNCSRVLMCGDNCKGRP